MEEKVTMSKPLHEAIESHVDLIMQHLSPEMENAIDKRKVFSDYMIGRVIRNFVESSKGSIDAKKAHAHELYLQYMQDWEEKYGK